MVVIIRVTTIKHILYITATMLIFSGILSSIENPQGVRILKLLPLTCTKGCMKTFSKITTSVVRYFSAVFYNSYNTGAMFKSTILNGGFVFRNRL